MLGVASTTSVPVTRGLKPSGAVWIEGAMSRGATSASTSATLIV
jgi:hypothetical protein